MKLFGGGQIKWEEPCQLALLWVTRQSGEGTRSSAVSSCSLLCLFPVPGHLMGCVLRLQTHPPVCDLAFGRGVLEAGSQLGSAVGALESGWKRAEGLLFPVYLPFLRSLRQGSFVPTAFVLAHPLPAERHPLLRSLCPAPQEVLVTPSLPGSSLGVVVAAFSSYFPITSVFPVHCFSSATPISLNPYIRFSLVRYLVWFLFSSQGPHWYRMEDK